MSRVLVISEDTTVAAQLESTDSEDAFQVTQTGWGAWDVKALADRAADLFLFDYRNPGSIPKGVASLLASELRRHDPQTPIIFVADFDPVLRETIQAAIGERNVTFAGTDAFANVNRIRQVLAGSAARDDAAVKPAALLGAPREKIRAFPHLVPDLRSPKTGRIDTKRVSALFAVPINRLAKSLGVESAAVYKTPDAPSLQPRLLLYERIAKPLLSLIGSEEGLRIWLNTPEPDLENEIPRELLLNGEGEVVARLLEDMQDGQPG